LYGCRRYVIQAQTLKDGKPVEAMSIDEDSVDILKAAPPHKVKETGGPQPTPQRERAVTR
jgi:hypothetical protein